MLRQNLILLVDTNEVGVEQLYLSNYIYGAFEPEDVLIKLKDIIVNCNTNYRHCITTMKNLTKLNTHSRIILNDIQNFEFNPLCVKDNRLYNIVRHLYVINTSSNYKNIDINIDKFEYVARDIKEITVSPRSIVVISATCDFFNIEYCITERIELDA